MCKWCEAKKDLQIVASCLPLLTKVDYPLARTAVGLAIISEDDIRRAALQEEKDNVFVVDIRNLFDQSDPKERGVMITIMILNVLEDALTEIDHILKRHGGYMTIPVDSDDGLQEIDNFLDELFKGGPDV